MAVSVHRPYYRLQVGDLQTLNAIDSGGPQINRLIEAYLTHGTGTGAADVVARASYTINASGTQSVDFAAGALAESDGTAATFAKVKVLIVSKTAGSGTFSVSRPAANGAPFFANASDESGTLSDTGSAFILQNGDTGFTITAGTGDLMTITEKGGAASVTVELIAIGTSA